jgi:hypothetical protein
MGRREPLGCREGVGVKKMKYYLSLLQALFLRYLILKSQTFPQSSGYPPGSGLRQGLCLRFGLPSWPNLH